MRILHIASGDFFSTYGGGQVYVKNIADAMIDAGLFLAIVSTVSSTEKPQSKDYRSARLVEIPVGFDDSDLAKILKTLKPDLIHAHSRKDQVCRVGRDLGIPVVVTAHHGGILCSAGTRLNSKDEICHAQIGHRNCLPCVLRNIPTGLTLWYPLMKFLTEEKYQRLGKALHKVPFIPFLTPVGTAAECIANKLRMWSDIAECCTRMIAPCMDIADAMVENGLPKEKITVLPHGIKMPKVRPNYPEILDGKIKFFYVGRICEAKGVHVLLDAFSMVRSTKAELHLIGGAGSKHEYRYMNRLQKRFKQDSRIIWHGKMAPKDIFEETSNFHVAVTASLLEAFGLNIAEALVLGKPVLSTRCGGAEIQIQDGENGWLVPTNNAAALADKINYIMANSDKLSAMSAKCNAVSIEEHIQSLVQIYKEILTNVKNTD